MDIRRSPSPLLASTAQIQPSGHATTVKRSGPGPAGRRRWLSSHLRPVARAPLPTRRAVPRTALPPHPDPEGGQAQPMPPKRAMQFGGRQGQGLGSRRLIDGDRGPHLPSLHAHPHVHGWRARRRNPQVHAGERRLPACGSRPAGGRARHGS